MKSWQSFQLGSLCSVSSGGTPSRTNRTYFGGDIPWVKIGDMLQGVVTTTEETITDLAIRDSSAKILPPGTVLISIFATIGRTAVLGTEAATNQAIAGLVPRDPGRLLPSYLRRYLDSVVGDLAGKARGVAQSNINLSILKSLEIPIPPKTEQERIVEILDRSDILRAQRAKSLALLDDLTVSIFLDMFGEPFENKRGWQMCQVGEVGRVQLGRQRAPKYQTGNFSKPYMRVANVFEGRIDLSDVLTMDFNDTDYPKYRLRYGDILLNEGQSTELVGRPAIWCDEIAECCFQNTLVRFQAFERLVDHRFAFAVFQRYFRTGQFAKISSKTSSVAHLGSGRFAKMPFPIPPRALQQEFVERVSVLDNIKRASATHLAELEALFASLQHRAFRGEL